MPLVIKENKVVDPLIVLGNTIMLVALWDMDDATRQRLIAARLIVLGMRERLF